MVTSGSNKSKIMTLCQTSFMFEQGGEINSSGAAVENRLEVFKGVAVLIVGMFARARVWWSTLLTLVCGWLHNICSINLKMILGICQSIESCRRITILLSIYVCLNTHWHLCTFTRILIQLNYFGEFNLIITDRYDAQNSSSFKNTSFESSSVSMKPHGKNNNPSGRIDWYFWPDDTQKCLLFSHYDVSLQLHFNFFCITWKALHKL